VIFIPTSASSPAESRCLESLRLSLLLLFSLSFYSVTLSHLLGRPGVLGWLLKFSPFGFYASGFAPASKLFLLLFAALPNSNCLPVIVL
jgi:hypothetical protein